MSGFGEVSAGLGNVESKAEQVKAMLHEAKELAADAAVLITSAASGTIQADVETALAQFTQVTGGVEELAQYLDAGVEGIGRIRAALLGENPPPSDDAPPPAAPSTPAPASAPATPLSARSPVKSWAEQQREKLPPYRTSGIYVDEDGNTELVQSGQEPDGEHIALGAHLREQGYPEGGNGRVTASEHVETKVAWRQRNAGVAHVEVVVNNVMCQGQYSCPEVIPDVLLPGQTLTVHDPVGSETFTGRSQP